MTELPPHDLLTEDVVLAACLLEQATPAMVDAGLRSEHFFDPAGGLLFSACAELSRAGGVDLPGVVALLRDRGQLAGVGGIDKITRRLDAPSVNDLSESVTRLQELAQARRARTELQTALAALETEGSTVAARLAAVREAATRVASGATAGRGLAGIKGVTEWQGDLPPIPWLSERLHLATPGRPYAIIGYAGVGKTLLAYDLALAVSAPGDGVSMCWGGCVISRRGRVLLLDLEVGEYLLRQRLTRLAAGRGAQLSDWAGRLDWACHPDLSLLDREAEARLVATLRGYMLVIIDSLTMLVQGADENDAGVMTKALGLLARVSEKSGCGVVVLHHAGKPPTDGKRPAHLAGRGSSAIQGIWSAQLLAANEDGALVLEWGKSQWGNLPERVICKVVDVGERGPNGMTAAVTFQTAQVGPDATSDDPEAVTPVLRAKRSILDYLGAVGEASYNDLKSKHRSTNNTTFSKAVADLLVDERIFKSRAGRTVTYTLTPRSDETSSQHAPNQAGMRSESTSSQPHQNAWDEEAI